MEARGPRHRRNRTALVHLLERILLARGFGTQRFPPSILAQVHAGVEAGDLIAVAVKQQSLVRLEEIPGGGVREPGSARMNDFGFTLE